MISELSTEHLITLMQLPRIGRKTAYRLLSKLNDTFRDTHDILDFTNRNSGEYKLPNYSYDDINNAWEKANSIINLSLDNDIRIISFLDFNYPKQLLSMDDFPLVINVKGNLKSLTEKQNIAVIGTRTPTDYGCNKGKGFALYFANEGFNIVSGLAVGCDTVGHEGALENHKTTTAVLAHGLDTVYPKENRDLADRILDNNGLLISEYFIKQRPIGNFFIERDRIQAGLSDCVFVVETDVKGGTMHTVNFCLNYKRILACMRHPGEYLNEPKTQGNQMLIRQGKALSIGSTAELTDLILRIKNRPHVVLDEFKPETSTNKTNTNNSKKDQLGLWD